MIDWVGIGTFLIGLAAVGTLVWTVFQQRSINEHGRKIDELEVKRHGRNKGV